MELVKIMYRFADGHVEELEVEPEVAETLKELDRQEYNNTQKESRRHVLFSGMEYEGENLIDPRLNTELTAISRIDTRRLRVALQQLKPQQQALIYTLYLSSNPLSQAEYAAVLGVREESVKQNAWRARLALKKILEKL
jgi:DNA-directed RNA polymerase specialized sigma24 family protein